ncbi:MAG: hypothetical protein GX593_13325 [Actinomycetales bacterium]|nr:hypothetical protein [Actinomycetales bacterium]
MDPSRSRARGHLVAVAASVLVALVGASGVASASAVDRVAAAPASGIARADAVQANAVQISNVRLAPVRAGTVSVHLNAGLLAAQAQAQRDAEIAARFPEPEPRVLTVREQAAAVLADLPGGDAVEIAWNHPDIGNHLGGVRLDVPTVMMLNEHRFKAQPERVESTVKHEIAHYYQGALIEKSASKGDWWSGYWKVDAALKPVFGAKWMELSADCVAIELGADWTHYTADCSGKAKKRAVAALIEGRLS